MAVLVAFQSTQSAQLEKNTEQDTLAATQFPQTGWFALANELAQSSRKGTEPFQLRKCSAWAVRKMQPNRGLRNDFNTVVSMYRFKGGAGRTLSTANLLAPLVDALGASPNAPLLVARHDLTALA